MASFSHFWVLTLFLATVLEGSRLASSQSYDGGRAAQDLLSLSSATRKLLDDPTLIGKNSVLPASGEWCVPADGVPDQQLLANLNFACANGADCIPMQPGRPCFEPNTLLFHAAYAMNDYFQYHGRNPQACSFSGTGSFTNKDPSTKRCKFPG
ncbi:major pollen allergen Ole e 10-like [Syzygium oleosum]|uniref:major pollen allergen Ole e 10-like n=1 Tax=Syzygium oleosum TaxID=219896 RepID=UPI0024BA48D1|nr:major pollen allergen Ole e 10-like [Syzygium oleosum]